jgi:CheY-like chemotaxis protein
MIAELFWAGRAQQREVRLRKAATAANEAKTAFLANVSHEIRTPLNGVLGMAQELRESQLTKDQQELVQVIIGAGELLVSTIDDVLDISKIEAGRLEMEHVPLNLEQSLRHNLGLHARRAKEKGLTLTLEIAPDVPRFVAGDPMRLGQVLNNLVSNALKFTHSGSVAVSVTSSGNAPPGYTAIHVGVRDTGIGIEPGAIERIFEPFTQADAGTARQAGGTGLGLTICRRICRQMGGDLTAESIVGEGSNFVASIHLQPLHAADVALLDQDDATGKSTSKGLFAEQPKRQDGQTTLNTQPAPPRQLQNLEPPEAPAQSLPTGANVGSPTLLLVDDSRTNRMVIQRFLKDRARLIVEAENGSEAVEAVLSQKFDLILMDIQMPGMDGVEATRRIRAYERDQKLPETPIIAVTANVMVHQVQEYRDNGMNKVIAKPVKKAEILRLLEEFSSQQAA